MQLTLLQAKCSLTKNKHPKFEFLETAFLKDEKQNADYRGYAPKFDKFELFHGKETKKDAL
jgi:hypothetical protein